MKKHLLSTLENSRNYTLAVAAAMPADRFSSRPVEGMMSFGELLNHIAYGIQWWEDNFIKGKDTGWNPPESKEDLAQTIHYINEAYDSLKKTLEQSDTDEKVLNGFYATLDHITHHRGQAVVHLRLHSMVPPEYVY